MKETLFTLKKGDDGLVYVQPLPEDSFAYIVRDAIEWLKGLFARRPRIWIGQDGAVRYFH